MKILVLRFSSIGDIVLTTPVLRCIKTQHPEHELHFATKPQFAQLLNNNPYLHKVHTLDGDLNDLIRQLKAEKFDLIIDLHRNIRTRLIRSALRVKTQAFDKLNWEKWLMVTFKINILPYEHIVDRYLATARSLHVQNDGRGLDFFIPPDTHLSGFEIPESYSVYAMGAQHNTKKLPLHKQIELLTHINGPVLLIGGAEDAEAGAALAKAAGNALNLCGKLSIAQSALLMQNCARVYTHDTGMMHIAAALQKPIVSIWGNTMPEFGMSPYYGYGGVGKSYPLEVKELDCRPCSKIGYKQCPKGHFNCMNQLDFSEIPEM